MATKFSRLVAEKKEVLHDALLALGYSKDRWGHYKKDAKCKDGKTRTYRFIFKPRVIRREIRSQSGEWIMLSSATWGNVGVNAEGKLTGFQRNSYLFG